MQREIKKKTLTYGVAAVLLVTILAASIYNFGGQFTPTPALFSELQTFSSFEELENFITTNIETANQNQNAYALDSMKNSREETLTTQDSMGAMPMDPSPSHAEDGELTDYSGTNLQVEGVDEADMIKTDGEYIYIVSGGNLTIVKAYPPEQAAVVSKISVEGSITGILLKDNKLVVFETEYQIYPLYEIGVSTSSVDNQSVNEVKTEDEDPIKSTEPSNRTTPSTEPDFPIDDIEPAKPFIPIYEPPTSNVKVYDVSNKANPVLVRTVSLDGSLSGSRMIGDYVYIVNNQLATQPNYTNEEIDVVLPVIKGDDVIEVEADKVHYIDVADQIYYTTTIVAINTQDDTVQPTYEAFLTSSTSNMYVSLNNMYLVAPDTNGWLSIRSDEQPRQETLIYRVKLDQQTIAVEAEGAVPGFVLNQFSMDENNGYFRIATTTWTSSWTEETFTSESTNNLFVLDMDLNIAGKLENIAPDESIYSVRFMGDKVYMVTFKQIDPFYVIDTSNPTQPTILGYLKIPGYSSYLHPYDATHIIGVGMENSSLKLSLFDVTDFTSPKEIAKYTVEGGYSSSNALWDHKAFLFDRTKNLLALPVTVNTYDEVFDGVIERGDMPNDTDGTINGDEETKEGSDVVIETREDMIIMSSQYQGAYIFHVSVEQGFVLKGDITHPSNNQYQNNAPINRIIYIEDAIYTISDQLVKVNNLESLEPITQIQIS